MRLDKYLAQMSVGTRSEVKKIIKSGRVFVNGQCVQKAEHKVDENADRVEVDGCKVAYAAYEYYMLNKPQGVVSAVSDARDQTVVSLIRDSRRNDLFPVGRLDKDTEGLLLITNDGPLSHALLSPGRHVDKTYLLWADGVVTGEDVQRLEQGVDIGDDKMTLPARAQILEVKDQRTCMTLTIHEGRYHQVKRMLAAVGKPVVYLKRLQMGSLTLDESLEPGQYRTLTPEEVEALKGGSR